MHQLLALLAFIILPTQFNAAIPYFIMENKRMGAVNFSIDAQLITTLKQHLPLTHFLETGTFRGDTIELIAHQFDHLYSVELSEKYYQDAKERFEHHPHIQLFQDTSPTIIQQIQPTLASQSTVYWLDAHWCVASSTAGETSQCLLLAELHAIKQLNDDSIIIIDDARLFLAAPPAPHEISDWPTLNSIIKTLYELSSHHHITILNDCILFFPARIQKVIDEYAHKEGVDWLTVMDKSRDYDKLLTQLKEKDALIMQLHQACQQATANKTEPKIEHSTAKNPLKRLFKLRDRA